MTNFKNLSTADRVQKLEAFFGVTEQMQRRIGTFIVVWGMFELTCESLVWATKGEEPAGKYPSTDRKPISDLLNEIKEWSGDTNHPVAVCAAVLSEAAIDLLAYRNAIIHGRLFQGPTFISNTSLVGELRKRPQARACIDDNLLDLAAQAADILFKCGMRMAAMVGQESLNPEIFYLDMLNEVRHAQSIANELRYLTELMNHEKY